jgi:hypothetical protein
VSAIDGTLHEIQIPSNKPQQKTYFKQSNYFIDWAKTIDEGGPLMNMSSIKLGLLKENDK